MASDTYIFTTRGPITKSIQNGLFVRRVVPAFKSFVRLYVLADPRTHSEVDAFEDYGTQLMPSQIRTEADPLSKSVSIFSKPSYLNRIKIGSVSIYFRLHFLGSLLL